MLMHEKERYVTKNNILAEEKRIGYFVKQAYKFVYIESKIFVINFLALIICRHVIFEVFILG